MKKTHYDFLVIGTGIAGLYFALKASRLGKVCMITKGTTQESSTILAQGGVAASISPADSPEKHMQDTLTAGAGLCDKKAVEVLVHDGVECIDELIQWGLEFTKNSEGKLDLGKEGGHSINRILHSRDHTGFDMHHFLAQKAQNNPEIEIFENCMAIDLITEHHLNKESPKKPARCYGAYVFNTSTDKVDSISAHYTCLATGGAGRIYPNTTNPSVATGDGIAMAYRAGCRVRNMEFVQFHPTAFYGTTDRAFLISEALRGRGAKLKLANGEEFMHKYHELGELAPRDIVARAIDAELKKTGDKFVLIDVTHLPSEAVKTEFPHIYNTLQEKYNLDCTQNPIPVVPAAHYICGGILTGINATTDLKGLYGVGECASTGVHGANRLASNSLLESLVFAARATTDIEKNPLKPAENINIPAWNERHTQEVQEWGIIAHHQLEIQRIMWGYIGIVRSRSRLKRALTIIDATYEDIRELYYRSRLNRELLELRNMALNAQLIIRSAAKRQESRGLHYMIDFPENRKESRVDTVLQPFLHPSLHKK